MVCLSPRIHLRRKIANASMRGNTNSRAKDVYDMWCISELQKDPAKLALAVKNVFMDRKTLIPKNLPEFVEELDTLVLGNAWKSILFRDAPLSFESTLKALIEFLRRVQL